MIKELIKAFKENPRQTIEDLLLLLFIAFLFYVSIWIFY